MQSEDLPQAEHFQSLEELEVTEGVATTDTVIRSLLCLGFFIILVMTLFNTYFYIYK